MSSTDNKCDFSEFAPLRGNFDPRPDDSIEKPSYPDLAKRSDIQGAIIVQASVGLDGKMIKACALDGPALLQEASEKAALKSSLAPALLNANPRYLERTMVYC